MMKKKRKRANLFLNNPIILRQIQMKLQVMIVLLK